MGSVPRYPGKRNNATTITIDSAAPRPENRTPRYPGPEFTGVPDLSTVLQLVGSLLKVGSAPGVGPTPIHILERC